MLKDFTNSPLSDREKRLFAFIAKVTRTSNQVTQGDVDELTQGGWSDEAIFDAITVCSLFNFYNRWCDASGVQDMSPAAYEMSGKRLGERGYFQGWNSGESR